MNDFLPLANQTDEELLKTVYLTKNVDTLTLELATRLQHALDELRKPPRHIEDILSRYGREAPTDGDDT